jgi:gluconate 2-dehydrogenase alpha chain
LTSIPEALATGNLDLRTQCRVIRIGTDKRGRVDGAEYVDAQGQRRFQKARTVILSAYTFESLRLLFVSGDSKRPDGLGNNRAQLGKHFMTKMFAHVDGYFPETIFNRHTGPAAQGLVLDDFFASGFDSLKQGFIGGATLGAEQQFLPIQISREALPAGVQRWGKPYKDHLRHWQHFGVVRIQPDTLSYRNNFIELDPHYRDRSGIGLPVLRITYDLRENEHRLADWMEAKAEEILNVMGATNTWRGDRFTGVGSSHDFGGARMGEDPEKSVVNSELEVHDTPGLYVYSGATFPSCPGINPTLSLLALVYRAAERLVKRLTTEANR